VAVAVLGEPLLDERFARAGGSRCIFFFNYPLAPGLPTRQRWSLLRTSCHLAHQFVGPGVGDLAHPAAFGLNSMCRFRGSSVTEAVL